MRVVLALLALAGLVSGNAFLEDGMEYEYEETGIQNAGTLDYDPSAAGLAWKSLVRLQVAGDTINVRVSDIEGSQYVGAYPIDHSAWGNTTYSSFAGGYEFSIKYDNGKVVSADVPSSLNTAQRNTLKAAIANLQINLGNTRFSLSQEKLLHGDCRVHYTINDNLITRSVSHFGDCANRKFRAIDNWKGWRCDGQHMAEAQIRDGKFTEGRTSPEPMYSKSDSYYSVVKKGDRYQVNRMGVVAVVNAQPFETEGVSHFVYTQRTLTLKSAKPSDGSIKPSGTVTLTDMTYEFSDTEYQWNVDRDLKAREPFFTSGHIFEFDQGTLEGGAMAALDEMYNNLDLHEVTPENIAKLHRYGNNNIMPYFWSMDYNTLKSVFNRLRADVSEAGVTKRNFFTEYIGSIGTTASAMVIRDAINEGLFDNSRDAARALTSIPFHIKRPNTQLVKELESLFTTNTDKLISMALPLTIAHLVRMTCERAGKLADMGQCVSEFSNKYAQQYYDQFINTAQYEEKVLAINFLNNLRWGSVSKLLEPVIYGEVEGIDDALQARAVRAAVWNTFITDNTADVLLPVFTNMLNGHETRIAALQVLSWGKVRVTTLSTIINILFYEQNYEVLNFAYSHFEKYASSIDPCQKDKTDMFAYFLKFLKQAGNHKVEYGLGISKTFSQEFQKEKYGYGGKTDINVIGSPHSLTPLSIGFDTIASLYHGYHFHILGIHLRIEGVAKALVRKFKQLPEGQWKITELAQMLSSIGVEKKDNQPVRVEVIVVMKGVVVINRVYDERSTEEGGKISDFLRDLQGATTGNEYSINHQRGLVVGHNLYEQPTEAGSPLVYTTSFTVMGSLKATIKRGLSRGVMFRDVNYDIHLMGHATNMMFFQVAATKKRYVINQDRIYAAHMPRHFVVGVNLVKKELGLQIKRPPIDNPAINIMHSRTQLNVFKTDLSDPHVSDNCPTCPNSYVLSKGDAYKKSRVIVDDENLEIGSWFKSGYFDCEMNIDDAYTVGNAIQAFSPLNKSPKTLMTSVFMGVAQINSYFLWFPRAEQCGVYHRWTQSRTSPVHEIDINIQGKIENNGIKYGMEGKKILLKVNMKLKGEPVDRDFKFQLKYEYSPGNRKNTVRAQFARQGATEVGMKEYSVCLSANNEFPDFPTQMMPKKFDNELHLTGDVLIKYGEGNSCGSVPGEVKIILDHQTTALQYEEMRQDPFYMKCMEEVKKPEWRNRNGLPFTTNCWMTIINAGLARKYTWDVQFTRMSPFVQGVISQALSVTKTVMLPYWQTDVDGLAALISNNQKIHVDLEYKKQDKFMDVKLTTNEGVQTYLDVPVTNDVRNGVLRNLMLNSFGNELVAGNILNFCIQSSGSVIPLDNQVKAISDFPYSPKDCWSLISAHCSPQPTYAIFTKKNSQMPLAMKAHVGGHVVELTPTSSTDMSVTVNGSPFLVVEGETSSFKQDDQTIFGITKWGPVYTVVSWPNVAAIFDGTFVEVIPAPSVKGQHCGVCGNFDGNYKNDIIDKNGVPISVDMMASAWCE